MELDTDILRSTYLDSVRPTSITNPVPIVCGRIENDHEPNLDRATPAPPPIRLRRRAVTPTCKDIPTKFGECASARSSNPRLQTCPKPTFIEDTESEFTVQINRLENRACEGSGYQIKYNMYEDPDSPEELIIDLDRDDCKSDSENESKSNSLDKYRTCISELETTKVDDKMSSQEDVLPCLSKSNSSVPLNNSNSNRSATGGHNVQHHGEWMNMKVRPSDPPEYDLHQALEIGSNANHMHHFPSTHVQHTYQYESSAVERDYGILPVHRYRFENNSYYDCNTDMGNIEGRYSRQFRGMDRVDSKGTNRMRSWHIPENEVVQKSHPLKEEGPLASLYHYCEKVPLSNEANSIQRLRDRFEKESTRSQYQMVHNHSPASTFIPKKILHGSQDMPLKPSKYCKQLHPNSNNYRRLEPYHTSSSDHCMKQQRMSMHMSRSSSLENVPIVDDPWRSNRSRLFGVNISQNPCSIGISNKPALDTAEHKDKENQPGSSTVTQEGSEDSGIGLPSSERSTEESEPSNVQQDLDDTELELSSEEIHPTPDVNQSPLPSTQSHPACRPKEKSLSVFESGVVYDSGGFMGSYASRNRRKHILDRRHPALQNNLSKTGEQYAKGVVDISPLSELHSSPARTFSSESGDEQCLGDASLSRDWRDLPNDSLSDFKALVDSFDKSPLKPTSGSKAAEQFPVMVGTQNSKFRPPIPQKNASTRYTCEFCGRINLSLKAIKRHNAKVYKCFLCNEQFCLLKLLSKHRTTCPL